MEKYFTIYAHGEQAEQAAAAVIGPRCYSRIEENGRALAQIETVADGLVSVAYIKTAEDVREVLHKLAILGFIGCEYSICETIEEGCYAHDTETERGTIAEAEETEETTEEQTAPAEEQTTETEEEEEEKTMEPEYKHIYVEEARRQLEARTDRSAWDRAVTEDAIDLLDTVNDRCEQVTRQFAETEEGGAAHVRDLFVSRVSLMNIMKNGAESWSAYSWGGCGLVYDSDIAEHYCTPSELKKVRGGDRRPNSREEWLDVQARALRQAAGRAADALITASHKTYTVKGA